MRKKCIVDISKLQCWDEENAPKKGVFEQLHEDADLHRGDGRAVCWYRWPQKVTNIAFEHMSTKWVTAVVQLRKSIDQNVHENITLLNSDGTSKLNIISADVVLTGRSFSRK